MKTKHTKGKWSIAGYKTATVICNYLTINQEFKSSQMDSETNVETESEANAKLIAAAPEILKHAIINYLRLLVYMPNILRNTMDGQEILVNALTPIQLATGQDRQELQDYFGDLSVRVKYNKITLAKAIEEATE